VWIYQKKFKDLTWKGVMNSSNILIKEAYNQILADPSSRYVKNRFDLLDENYYSFSIKGNGLLYCVLMKVTDYKAMVGVSYLDIPREAAEALSRYIFREHPRIHQIIYSDLKYGMGYSTGYDTYRIFLPETESELHKRLSSKGWYNIKREKRLIGEEIGEVKFLEYKTEEIPDEVVEQYFKMKEKTHGGYYSLGPKEYLRKFNVTDAYIMLAGEKIVAEIFSCEQTEEVFLENLTYDTDYSRFSPGQVLYDYYLTRLVEKGNKVLVLGGGDYSYKKRYGSTKEHLYHSVVFRTPFHFIPFAIDKMKGIIQK